jgi:hypothetical protein
MDAKTHKRIQLGLILVLLLATARTAYVLYQRHKVASEPPPSTLGFKMTNDDFVNPPKIYAYDLKSAAKELVGKTVWVREGNAIPFYAYNASSRSADMSHKLGLLPPLEKLLVNDVILQRAPASLSPGQVAIVHKSILMIFERAGQSGTFAASIGTNVGDDFQFTANDEFFFADPHELYKHWPPEVWAAIDRHEAVKGMNELQVSFALGSIAGATPGDYGNRQAQYRNGDKLVTVTFADNRAVEIVTTRAID